MGIWDWWAEGKEDADFNQTAQPGSEGNGIKVLGVSVTHSRKPGKYDPEWSGEPEINGFS